jgi:citrate synthase
MDNSLTKINSIISLPVCFSCTVLFWTKPWITFFSGVMKHTYIHEDLKTMMSSFRYDAHPMGMLIATLSAMSTFHPEANPALVGQNVYNNEKVRNKQIHRLLGTIPTIAAYSYRHRIGRYVVFICL